MIETSPFGKTGHQSTRVIFGAAALGGVGILRIDSGLLLPGNDAPQRTAAVIDLDGTLAGFDAAEAKTIAMASQYVDDVTSNPICMYFRTAPSPGRKAVSPTG